MSIEYVTEKEQQLAQALTSANKVIDNAITRINELERLVQERDALKAQLETANGGWYDKLLEATLERDKLAAENKVLRDALEQVTEIGGIAAVSIASAALTRSKS